MRRFLPFLVVLPLLAACVSSHPTPPMTLTGLPPGVDAPDGHMLGNPLPLGLEAQGKAPVEDGVTLIVEATGMYDRAGPVGLALYDSSKDFASDRSIRMIYLAPQNGRVRWEVQGLERGTYAVRAWQDWNCDAHLQTGRRGKPLEPYGFSGSACWRGAPPAWGAVSFEVEHAMNHVFFRMHQPY